MIIVDEEHDHSFKQQEGLRYSARDLAIVRAKRAGNVPVILGLGDANAGTIQHARSGTDTRLRAAGPGRRRHGRRR